MSNVMVRVFVFVVILLFVVDTCGAAEPVDEADVQQPVFSMEDHRTPSKKLLISTDDEYRNDNRVVGVGSCSADDILIYQGPSPPLSNGIPTYMAHILNVCTAAGSCNISDIHLNCGAFASARLMVDPYIFRRIAYNDCLVNDGKPLLPGQAIAFQYANTFKYPLSVKSVICN